MNVAAVGAEDGLKGEKAACDGEGGIEEGNSQGNQGSGHAEDGGCLL